MFSILQLEQIVLVQLLDIIQGDNILLEWLIFFKRWPYYGSESESESEDLDLLLKKQSQIKEQWTNTYHIQKRVIFEEFFFFFEKYDLVACWKNNFHHSKLW